MKIWYIYIYVYITSSYCVYSIVLFRTVSYRTISCNFYTCTKYQMCVFKVTNSNIFFLRLELEKDPKKMAQDCGRRAQHRCWEGDVEMHESWIWKPRGRSSSWAHSLFCFGICQELAPNFRSNKNLEPQTTLHKSRWRESYASQEGISGFKKTTCSPEK